MINKSDLSETSISSINLGIEKPDAYFLTDDDKTRLYAVEIGLNVIGTTRVIADAAVQGNIKTLEETAQLLCNLKDKNNYPITSEIISDIVKVVENRIKIKNEIIKNDKDIDFIKKMKNTIKKIEESNTPKDPFSLFGIEHGYGWYGLTLPIIEEIRLYNIANPDNQIYIDQIKEKFGSLRIYVSGEPDYLDAMIKKAEYESNYICEICGARGNTEKIDGWYWTLCDDHKKARIDSKGDHDLADRLYKQSLDIKNYGWK
jgi:hypothetical protein